MHNKKISPSKILFAGAMDTELKPLLKRLDKVKSSKLLNVFPLYEAQYKSTKVFIVQTFVGDVNASVAGFEAIRKVDPDYVIKFGAVGGSFSESKAGDIIVPLGFFHRTGWITKDNKTHLPTSDASRWDSVFGEKDYQIQESRHNLGGMPYYFPVNANLIKSSIQVLASLKLGYQTAYVGGGNMWMFDQSVLNNVADSMLPKKKRHNRFVSDMESYSLAHVCYLTHKPFFGCYVVASNDYLNEEYNPLLVPGQMNHLVPYILSLANNLISK